MAIAVDDTSGCMFRNPWFRSTSTSSHDKSSSLCPSASFSRQDLELVKLDIELFAIRSQHTQGLDCVFVQQPNFVIRFRPVLVRFSKAALLPVEESGRRSYSSLVFFPPKKALQLTL